MTRSATYDPHENGPKAARKPRQSRRQDAAPTSSEPRESSTRLNQLIGNRVTGSLLTTNREAGHLIAAPRPGLSSRVQRVPDKPEAKKEPTPGEIAAAGLKRGPKNKKAWQRSTRLSGSAKPASQRVTVDAKTVFAGLKTVDGSQFDKAFQQAEQAGWARKEAGLPQAFLASESAIRPLVVNHQSERTADTNVVLDTQDTKGGHLMWVTETNLIWQVQAEAFLDVSKIDAKMFAPTKQHELGHKTIAETIQADLTKRLQAELEQSLPSKDNPLKKSGKNWYREGMKTIIQQIQLAIDRYLDWWTELAEKADAAWDAQEAKTLSGIAAARKQTHQPAAPVHADE